MANDEHIALLKQDVRAWNAWRDENPNTSPNLKDARLDGADLTWIGVPEVSQWKSAFANLREADLSGADLIDANLAGADLTRANLREANLIRTYLHRATLVGADLREANLVRGNLSRANLTYADLRKVDLTFAELNEADLIEADLRGADLTQADLTRANLTGAKLVGANLGGAQLVETDLTGADLTGCRVYGVSAWGLKLEEAKQQNLVITGPGEPEVTVDNIEVAQFIYLMLNNQKVRDVIDTITSKAVLILGRFTDERKAVLDALREELRKRDYLPILFDFEKSEARDPVETITLLARMARFVIADITDAKAVLVELQAIVPGLPSVPVQPIILSTQEVSVMFNHFKHMPWFLKVHVYDDQEQLLADLGDKVIRPAELKVRELRGSTAYVRYFR